MVYVEDSIDRTRLLRLLSDRLELALDAARIDAILENKLTNEIRARIRAVREKTTAEEKLALIVPAAKLEAELPASLLSAVSVTNGTPDHHQLARLAFAVHGVETLRTFVDDFTEHGLQPPPHMGGFASRRSPG